MSLHAPPSAGGVISLNGLRSPSLPIVAHLTRAWHKRHVKTRQEDGYLTPGNGCCMIRRANVRDGRSGDARTQACSRDRAPGTHSYRFADAKLLPFLAPLFEKLDDYLPVLAAGVQASQLAPELTGAAGPRTYLLVVQNSDELRATGGFVSGIGVLTTNESDLGELTFQDSYAVENWAQPHPDPLPALRKYVLADLWATRDANWWPDYPSSARAIQEMYALNQGVSSDEVITVDMRALELVVGALEPLVLKETGEELTAASIRERIYEFRAPPPVEDPPSTDWREWPPEVQAWWGKRKDFPNAIEARCDWIRATRRLSMNLPTDRSFELVLQPTH